MGRSWAADDDDAACFIVLAALAARVRSRKQTSARPRYSVARVTRKLRGRSRPTDGKSDFLKAS